MNTGGDAAEQVVRISLEGAEYALRIAGAGAGKLGMQIFTVLKQEEKTKGKARLTGMLKSGRELKVFTVRQEDLKKFSQEAKRYGVLYCVLKDKNNKSPDAVVDVIARADDASKIQRITERFKLATVDTASIVSKVEKDRERVASKLSKPGQSEPERARPERMGDELEWARRITTPIRKEENAVNPALAKTEKSPLSEPDSMRQGRSNGSAREVTRPSVREKLNGYRQEIESAKRERAQPEREGTDKRSSRKALGDSAKTKSTKVPDKKTKER